MVELPRRLKKLLKSPFCSKARAEPRPRIAGSIALTVLLLVFVPAKPAYAQNARFDLIGPKIEVRVTRAGKTLPIAYVPNLQVSGQVITFITQHLHQPIASPAVLSKIGDRLRAEVHSFCENNQIPVLRFNAKDRQIDLVKPYFDKATRPGVVAVGIAQEFQSVFSAYKRPQPVAVNPAGVCC